MHSGTNVPNEIARQIHCSHMAMALWGCPRNGAQPGDSCHQAAHQASQALRYGLGSHHSTRPGPHLVIPSLM